jgi:hypothetical protein
VSVAWNAENPLTDYARHSRHLVTVVITFMHLSGKGEVVGRKHEINCACISPAPLDIFARG